MPEAQQNVTNIPSSRVEIIDPRTGLMSREWYRFFLNLFTLSGSGGNQTSLDDLQVGPPPQPDSGSGGGGGSGTVTSVDVSGGTTGLTTSGGPITTSGTITLAGTLDVDNGGTGATTAADARTNLSAAKSGANSDITSMTGVTGGISTPDYIDFDTAATVTRASGRLWWDNADGIQTLNLGMAGSNATMQVGQESYYRIKASSAITEGQVVMFTGTVGASGALEGAPATGLTAATAQYVMGVATESIALNGWGYVTEFGLVRGIDTSGGAEAWVDGQILYYNPSVAGGLTKTLPSAPNAKVVVAAVVYASASNGSLFIRPSFGGELGQYEGNVGFGTLSNNNLIQYDSGSSKWTNVSSLNGVPIGDVTPAAGTFTTLTATGQTSLGGAAGSEGLRVLNTSSAVNYWIAQGNTAGNSPLLRVAGADTNVAARYRTQASGSHVFETQTFGNQQFVASHTASAVNYVQVTGAATTVSPVISVQGSDSNIPITVQSKGTSPLIFQNGSAQRQLRIDGSVNGANHFNIISGATGQSPILKPADQSSDTNVAAVFQSKGTGAIDLAAGSRGVNISNGGTVTAITRTASGGPSYTTIPTVTVSAPTTAGGVQATASVTMFVASATASAGGTGYTVGDVLTVSGGTGSSATLTVATLSGSAVATVTITGAGSYTALASNPVSVTGGTGTGATFTLGYGVNTIVVGTAGSGYVEQPTVTFSSGSAAAYATVGSTPKIQTLGSNLSFYTPGGEQFRIAETTSGLTAVNFIQTSGNSTGAAPRFLGVGADANVGIVFSSKGTGDLSFRTNGTNQVQMTVAHTASAVNYVQVTGAATGGSPLISSQGSDASVSLNSTTKGSGIFRFYTDAGTVLQATISRTASAVNRLDLTGAAASAAPVLSAQGSDTNIDLALTPKGTGVVKTSGTGLRLSGSSSGYVGLTGAAAAGSTTYTLPAADGTSGQALTTNGSATLSWATPASSNITANGLWENNATISSNYTITSGNNALSSGPITVASGVTVTVPSGSVWTIV